MQTFSVAYRNSESDLTAGIPPEYLAHNTDEEKAAALAVLAGVAPDAAALREVAIMLELIDPPALPAPVAADETVVCAKGHKRTVRNGVPGQCSTCASETRRAVWYAQTVPAVGTARRLQHLVLSGWSIRHLSVECRTSIDMLSRLLHGRKDRIQKELADRVRAFFDQHRDEQGEGRGLPRFDHEERARWEYADAWTDIDDPDAIPMAVAA